MEKMRNKLWTLPVLMLLAGSMDLALFRCDVCGQIKFFDPDFVK